MRITYQSALHLSLPQIAELHTSAYGGGWTSTPAKLAEIFRVQNVDLALSLVAYDGRKPIGLAMLGRRRAHGWLYDFAITPSYRGKGLGTRLLQTTTREAAKAGVRDIDLDVWEKRDDAIRLYRSAGFQHVRTYLVLQATGAQLELGSHDIAPDWQVTPDLVETVIPWYAAAEDEPRPCWDRSLPSLLSYDDAQLLLLHDAGGPAACLHYAARPAAGPDPNRIRPMFVGLRAGAGIEHIRALFAAATQRTFADAGATTFRIALEPEQSQLVRLLNGMGVQVVARALGMQLSMTA